MEEIIECVGVFKRKQSSYRSRSTAYHKHTCIIWYDMMRYDMKKQMNKWMCACVCALQSMENVCFENSSNVRDCTCVVCRWFVLCMCMQLSWNIWAMFQLSVIILLAWNGWLIATTLVNMNYIHIYHHNNCMQYDLFKECTSTHRHTDTDTLLLLFLLHLSWW